MPQEEDEEDGVPLFTDLGSSLNWFANERAAPQMDENHAAAVSAVSVGVVGASSASSASVGSMDGEPLDRWQLLSGRGRGLDADRLPACLAKLYSDPDTEISSKKAFKLHEGLLEEEAAYGAEEAPRGELGGGEKVRGPGRRAKNRHKRVVEAMRQQAFDHERGIEYSEGGDAGA